MSAPCTCRFDAADFRRRAKDHHPASEIAGPGPAFLAHGDHALNRPLVRSLMSRSLRDAAVLIAVVDGADDAEGGAKVLLTRRTIKLRKHSGQVAFPGGSIDPEDASAAHAALREAQEEIGLDPAHVEIVGELPHYLAASGFSITPVLAVVRPGFSLVVNPHEVDEVFEVPLSFLMNPDNHRRESRVWEGAERHYYVIPYSRHHIWGVTAGIIRTLYERLYS
ncbi:CoA pyrophosphatase [Pseudohoeflea sp. DP4N28-3]|uniref:CoA pyrophosphatase n=1 Tax=Pseudohoeflea coraliihabitans TaxID=2860393 RepID=A0ABS6WJK8_9HYPH|nr:CoA pyrophosphatase [Pseudohoeflea sp. DP4N28-3]